ncbi:hypothetical protein APHACPA_0143 [Rickettsia amblyommatis str. Ac/Pa]|uniref:Uncharacterized protein n=1 Tax=Rickettsia amblyommatis str. Ac/Pa TaxID=1359164 RepID=A0A0F3N0G2_RICAM|nr:hypothetical protein APHACPA_0143 [Rickettsia amblyommatis str. Ac/Pa]
MLKFIILLYDSLCHSRRLFMLFPRRRESRTLKLFKSSLYPGFPPSRE